VQRLFFSFARGAPGIGLLLARVVSGLDLLTHAVLAIRQGGTPVQILLHAVSVGCGILLLAGLWTRVAAVSIALVTLLYCPFHHGDWWHWILLGNLSITVALLGPGAWSLDAKLSGWKRIEIPRR
jgi:putative oxidoreductase